MTFNEVTDGLNGVIANGVSVVSGSRITLANAGIYNIQFSAQIDKSDAGNDDIDIWLAKNGANVSWTNTSQTLVGATGGKVHRCLELHRERSGGRLLRVAVVIG